MNPKLKAKVLLGTFLISGLFVQMSNNSLIYAGKGDSSSAPCSPVGSPKPESSKEADKKEEKKPSKPIPEFSLASSSQENEPRREAFGAQSPFRFLRPVRRIGSPSLLSVFSSPSKKSKAEKSETTKTRAQKTFNRVIEFDCCAENSDLITELISKGANVNYSYDCGFTPLHFAVLSGQPKIVHLLICAGAKLDAQNTVGITPLHLAVLIGNTEIVNILVKAGAPLDAVNLRGETPLHLAAACVDSNVMRGLLAVRSGNIINKMDNEGHTAYDIAKHHHNEKVAILLENAHADTTLHPWVSKSLFCSKE